MWPLQDERLGVPLKVLYVTKRQITLGAVALLGVVMAVDVWRLWSMNVTHEQSISPVDGGAVQGVPALDVSHLADWKLFGEVADEEPIEVQVKATTLKLRLEGVVASPEGGSYAMISGAGGDTLYQEGDKLGSAGVKLLSIKGDRVILDNQGSIEELALDADSKTKFAWVESSDEPALEKHFEGTFSADLLQAGTSSGFAGEKSGEGSFLDRVSLSIIKSERGSIIGYGLSADPEVLALFNLQSDDVLVGVNGERMTSPLQALAMRHILRSATVLDLMVERHGRIENITINEKLVEKNNE